MGDIFHEENASDDESEHSTPRKVDDGRIAPVRRGMNDWEKPVQT